MRLSGIAAFALAVLACAGSAASAQEKPPPPPPRPDATPPPPPLVPPKDEGPKKGDLVLDPAAPGFFGFALGDDSEELVVGDERVVAATGRNWQPLWIKLPGFECRCDSVVMWGDRDRLVEAVERRREELSTAKPETILGPLVHAVYAEGSVFVRMNRQTIHADRVFLDFVRGKAYMVRVRMTGELEGRHGAPDTPLTVRADVVRAVTRDRYRAEKADVTTCTYSDPHYEFKTDWVEVDYRHAYATFETAMWPTVRADTPLGDDTPIFVLPKLGGNSGLAHTPIQSVALSHGSRFGTGLLTTWGGDVLRDDGTRWGDWKLHLDERGDRGPGVGVDLSHKTQPTRPGGTQDEYELSAYGQYDRAGSDSFSNRAFDGGTDATSNRKERGFAHWFGRTFLESPSVTNLIGTGWRVDSEISYYSDRGYLPEYDTSKVESQKEQETYVEASKHWGNQAVSILASYRLNNQAAALDRAPSDLVFTNYENQTQYAPSATYHLINQPVLSAEKTGLFPLNLSLQANVADVERRYDDRLANRIDDGIGWRGEWVRRGDLETRVTAPFSIGDVHVNPAFGGSIYGVDDANGFERQDAGSDGRYAGFYDLRADAQAWKAWPKASSGFFDLDGLRHVASVDAQFFDRFKVSDDPLGFQPNDPIDELAEERIGSLRVRNRLQTKRDGDVIDWLDYEARFLYFFKPSPEARQDLFGTREDFPEPLQNIDFPGEAKYVAQPRDGSAFWQHRARMEVLRNLWLVGEADYDMQRDALETSAAGVRWAADERASFYVGRRTIHGDSTIWTERMDYRLSNRWGVTVEYQEDTKTDKGLSTLFSLYRREHDFTFALEFNADRGAGNRAIWFTIYPNAFADGRTDPFSRRKPLDYDALKWYR